MFRFLKNIANNAKNASSMVRVAVAMKEGNEPIEADPEKYIVHDFRLNGRAITKLGVSFRDRVAEAVRNDFVDNGSKSLYRSNPWLFGVEAIISEMAVVAKNGNSQASWDRVTFWACGIIHGLYDLYEDGDYIELTICYDGMVKASKLGKNTDISRFDFYREDIIGDWAALLVQSRK